MDHAGCPPLQKSECFPVSGRLKGAVAVVTGAASGIGRAVIDRFLSEGAHGVIAVDRDCEPLAALAAQGAGRVETVVGDVRSVAVNEAAVQRAQDVYGKLNVVVANAGIFDFHRNLVDYPVDSLEMAFDEIFDINVLAPLKLARAAHAALAEHRGSLIVTASTSSKHPGGGGILYVASKHALLGVVRRLALEFAPLVRVNAVGPGGTLTNLRGAEANQDGDRSLADNADRSARRIAATTPLAFAQQPTDHADLYVLLASATEGRAMTGEILMSDGGIGVRKL